MTPHIKQIYKELLCMKLELCYKHNKLCISCGEVGTGLSINTQLADELYLKYSMVENKHMRQTSV